MFNRIWWWIVIISMNDACPSKELSQETKFTFCQSISETLSKEWFLILFFKEMSLNVNVLIKVEFHLQNNSKLFFWQYFSLEILHNISYIITHFTYHNSLMENCSSSPENKLINVVWIHFQKHQMLENKYLRRQWGRNKGEPESRYSHKFLDCTYIFGWKFVISKYLIK